jgi:tripartite-type tricarboxylate transporter receptor subunit TctC
VNAVNATLFSKLNFDLIRDISPAAGIHHEPLAMEVNPSVPVSTVAEFITLAKAIPARLTWHQAASARRTILPVNCSR